MSARVDRYSTRGELVLVLNCGSSSIKFALFDDQAVRRDPVWNGKVQGIGGPNPDFGETGVAPYPISLDAEHPYRGALQCIRERVTARLAGRRIAAIVHRVVHGGSKYFAPVRVDADVLADLRSYIPLAPLHQPFALEAVEILLRDAFISWEEEFVIDVTVRYWEKARKAGLLGANSASGWGADFGEFYRAVEWMGLQRHLKVAGIFARLTLRDNKPKYLADAPRFLHYIRSTANRYRQLGPLLQLVDEIEGTTPVTGFAYGRM